MKLYEKKQNEETEPVHLEVGSDNIIAVYAQETLRWMRFDDSDIQSVCDLSKPWHPVASYCISMLAALCFRPDPAQVLNLGRGGGTFERFFREKLPRVNLSTVELCRTVIKLAKDFFELPQASNIIESSGWKFVQSCDRKFDIVFVDLFDENGHLACMGEPQFYTDLSSIVAGSGLIVIDIAPSDEDALLSILLAIRPAFHQVLLATDSESSDMVLICSRDPFPAIAQALNRAEQLRSYLGIDFRESIQRFSKLPTPVLSE